MCSVYFVLCIVQHSLYTILGLDFSPDVDYRSQLLLFSVFQPVFMCINLQLSGELYQSMYIYMCIYIDLLFECIVNLDLYIVHFDY